MKKNLQVTDDVLAGRPMLAPGRALVAVSSVLLLLSLFWVISWMSDAGLLPTRSELRWLESQSSASEGGPTPLDDTTSVSIERTDCFGTCPMYRLTAYGSGRIEFVGIQFVCVKGPVTGQVDGQLVRRLIHGLQESGFFTFPDYTRYDVTDDAYVTTTLTNGARTHTVRHYLGDLSAPRMLRWMEDRVDEVAASHRWIGLRERSGRTCPMPDGKRRSIRDFEQ